MAVNALSEQQEKDLAYQHHLLFKPHCDHFKQFYFPKSSLVNTNLTPSISCWTAKPQVLGSLFEALKFGILLRADEHNALVNRLPDIANYAHEQLLFWQLKQPLTLGEPVQALTLTESESHLWDTCIIPRGDEFQSAILSGERLHFLAHFHLDYTCIRLTFCSVHLSQRLHPRPGAPENPDRSYTFVQCDDREYSYKWSEDRWDTNINNSNPQLVNPLFYCIPRPAQELADSQLPPSSPIPSSGWNESSRGWTLEIHPERCWCRKEVCDCGYRPDTPPTPKNVVLWAPRNKHLPYRE